MGPFLRGPVIDHIEGMRYFHHRLSYLTSARARLPLVLLLGLLSAITCEVTLFVAAKTGDFPYVPVLLVPLVCWVSHCLWPMVTSQLKVFVRGNLCLSPSGGGVHGIWVLWNLKGTPPVVIGGARICLGVVCI